MLPFVPFTDEEKKAIACENMQLVRQGSEEEDTRADSEAIIARALAEYLPVEGARSLHRSVAAQLLDIL